MDWDAWRAKYDRMSFAEHQAFNLVVPEPAPPVVLTPDASLEASLEAATEAELESRLDVGLEAAELEQTTSSPERAALGFGDVEPGPDAGASTVARSRAAVVPQDEIGRAHV